MEACILHQERPADSSKKKVYWIPELVNQVGTLCQFSACLSQIAVPFLPSHMTSIHTSRRKSPESFLLVLFAHFQRMPYYAIVPGTSMHRSYAAEDPAIHEGVLYYTISNWFLSEIDRPSLTISFVSFRSFTTPRDATRWALFRWKMAPSEFPNLSKAGNWQKRRT